MGESSLERSVRAALASVVEASRSLPPRVRVSTEGRVVGLRDGVASVTGLPQVCLEEIVLLGERARALVLGIEPDIYRVAVLDHDVELGAGARATATGHAATIEVSEDVLGRVLDPLGTPVDGGPALDAMSRAMPIEREAPPIIARGQVHQPMYTGVLAIDAMFPIGRGQRELILGDEGTGKTSLALDALLRQRDTDVIGVYVAVSRRRSETRRVVESLRANGGRWVVVTAPQDALAGMRYLAPYAGCAVAEFFVQRGEHTLVVFDDLTAHAVAWRELSLVMERPPGREAYPGDIFYLHSRLLERATQLSPEQGGGSMTALPLAGLESGRLSAFIPTNLISITDGQIVLSRQLFASGHKPAIDAGLSVSRVGGRAQPQAFRTLAGKLRLEYAAFLELERFARLGTRLEASTQRQLDVGQRIRALLRAPRSRPLGVFEEVVRLLLASEPDLLLRIETIDVPATAESLAVRLGQKRRDLKERVERDFTLTEDARKLLVKDVSRILRTRAEPRRG